MRGTIAHFGFGCGLLAIETSIRKLIELITEDDVVRYQMGPSQHEHAHALFNDLQTNVYSRFSNIWHFATRWHLQSLLLKSTHTYDERTHDSVSAAGQMEARADAAAQSVQEEVRRLDRMVQETKNVHAELLEARQRIEDEWKHWRNLQPWSS